MSENIRLVTVSCPDRETAVRLAKLSVGHRLASCAQIIPQIESFYWWEGEMEHANESLLLLKTEAREVPALEKLVKENHPYQVPEFLALGVDRALPEYRQWLIQELQP